MEAVPATLEVIFLSFEDLGLLPDASDREVWQTCQTEGILLITGNRRGGNDSLDEAIRELSDESTLPVVTISDPKELFRNRVVAEAAAEKLLNIVDQIETLRGVGRLYIP